jgi:hypothetical protein
MSQTLSPVDFIKQDSSNIQYFQAESPVVFAESTYDLRSMVNKDPLSYNVHYETSYLGTNSCSLSYQDIANYYKKFVSSNDSYFSDKSSLDVMFPGVRYLTPGIVVFERPPSFQHISVSFAQRDDIDDDTEDHEFYVPIPWQVYIASYNPKDMKLIDVRMYFTNSSLMHVDQHLYAPPIFNFFSNGKLCRPFFDNIEDVEKYPKTINGIIASSYDWVWNSGYNLDITENISQFLLKKKYYQFEKYLKTDDSKKRFKFLQNNQISSIPSTLHTGYIRSFFSCWQEIPLEDISQIVWSTYSKADFFYREQLDSTDLSTYITEYLNIHDLVVHEYEDNHYDEDGDNYCPDNCISEEDLLSSYSFRSLLSSHPAYDQELKRSIKEALIQVSKELSSSHISQRVPNGIGYNKIFIESLSSINSVT